MLIFQRLWLGNFRLLIFLSSFLLITNFSSQAFGQESLINYENSQYGVKLSYPSDWDIAVNENEIRLNSAVDNSNGFLNSIVIIAYPSYCESLEKLLPPVVLQIDSNLKNIVYL